MTSHTDLAGLTIMIAEDEALVAMDLLDLVEHAGGSTIGPCSTLAACFAAIKSTTPSAAILDVRLGSEEVFPVAEALVDRGVAVVFHSGHADSEAIRARFPQSGFCAKPASERQIIMALNEATGETRRIAAE